MELNRTNTDVFKITRFNDDSEFFSIDAAIFTEIISHYENFPVTVTKLSEVNTVHKEYSNARSERFVINVGYIKNYREYSKNFFIKKPREKNPNEAIPYLNLQGCDAPIPKLYAYYSEENESDIIITEVVNPLHEVGSDFMLREEIFKPFITATAEFNSVKISAEYKNFLFQRYDIVNQKIIPYKEKLEQIFIQIHEQEKYARFRQSFSQKTLDALLALHGKMCRRVISMERGLYHWDHSPYNSGWSELQNKLVLFDLEATLWAPRFDNIAVWIGGNDETYASKEVLAEFYLSIYNQRLGANISVDNFLYECYPLWLASKFQNTVWCFNDCDEKMMYYADLLANSKL
ncbi:MAG: hypothetical protein FWD71_04670 [Oscillospiraceae bacterium]|nr:hypothetical protein [Oscillospiraceae bacterium]